MTKRTGSIDQLAALMYIATTEGKLPRDMEYAAMIRNPDDREVWAAASMAAALNLNKNLGKDNPATEVLLLLQQVAQSLRRTEDRLMLELSAAMQGPILKAIEQLPRSDPKRRVLLDSALHEGAWTYFPLGQWEEAIQIHSKRAGLARADGDTYNELLALYYRSQAALYRDMCQEEGGVDLKRAWHMHRSDANSLLEALNDPSLLVEEGEREHRRKDLYCVSQADAIVLSILVKLLTGQEVVPLQGGTNFPQMAKPEFEDSDPVFGPWLAAIKKWEKHKQREQKNGPSLSSFCYSTMDATETGKLGIEPASMIRLLKAYVMNAEATSSGYGDNGLGWSNELLYDLRVGGALYRAVGKMLAKKILAEFDASPKPE